MDWLIAAVAVAMVILIVMTAVFAVRERRSAPQPDDESLDAELHALESTAERRRT